MFFFSVCQLIVDVLKNLRSLVALIIISRKFEEEKLRESNWTQTVQISNSSYRLVRASWSINAKFMQINMWSEKEEALIGPLGSLWSQNQDSLLQLIYFNPQDDSCGSAA